MSLAQPLRKVIEWVFVANAWHALFECGHRENFGKGPRPGLTSYRCWQCAPTEPGAS